MSLAPIAAGQVVDDWPAARQEIQNTVAHNIDTLFDRASPHTDPLTGVEYTADALFVKFCSLTQELSGPPYTVQRLAELALSPQSNYNASSLIKYLYALLKTVQTTATREDLDEERQVQAALQNTYTSGVVLDDIIWAKEPASPEPAGPHRAWESKPAVGMPPGG